MAGIGQYENARLNLEEATAISNKAGSRLLQFDCARVRLELAFDLKRADEATAIIESIYGPVVGAPLSDDILLRNLAARSQLALLESDPAIALRLATRLSDAITASSDPKYLRIWEKRAVLTQGIAHLQNA